MTVTVTNYDTHQRQPWSDNLFQIARDSRDVAIDLHVREHAVGPAAEWHSEARRGDPKVTRGPTQTHTHTNSGTYDGRLRQQARTQRVHPSKLHVALEQRAAVFSAQQTVRPDLAQEHRSAASTVRSAEIAVPAAGQPPQQARRSHHDKDDKGIPMQRETSAVRWWCKWRVRAW